MLLFHKHHPLITIMASVNYDPVAVLLAAGAVLSTVGDGNRDYPLAMLYVEKKGIPPFTALLLPVPLPPLPIYYKRYSTYYWYLFLRDLLTYLL